MQSVWIDQFLIVCSMPFSKVSMKSGGNWQSQGLSYLVQSDNYSLIIFLKCLGGQELNEFKTIGHFIDPPTNLCKILLIQGH